MATLRETVDILKKRKKIVDDTLDIAGSQMTPKIVPPAKTGGGVYSGLSETDITDVRKKRAEMDKKMGW